MGHRTKRRGHLNIFSASVHEVPIHPPIIEALAPYIAPSYP